MNTLTSFMRAWIICLTALLSSTLWAQGSAGTNATIESRYLIDIPTAGIVKDGAVAVDLEFFQADGMLASVSVGIYNRAVIGISYGGSNIIGTDRPTWNTAPGVSIRLRAIEESFAFPAIAVGFSSQGKETYIDRLNRYTIKAPGLYITGSKNYQAMGFLSLHGGINYSFERTDGDDDVNVFFGAEKTLGPFLSLIGEYDLGINDSNRDALGRGRGYLNIGLRSSFSNELTIGFVVKDILRNQQDNSFGSRVIQIEYVK